MVAQNENQLTDLLAQSSQILIFTGAGVSTNSGIPDFRGPNGVWKTKQPVMYQDFMNSAAARVEYWQQKLDGLDDFLQAQPNSTHRAIAELHRAGKLHTLVTQNIDGLHEKAGVPPEKLVELHGSNSRVECQTCGAGAQVEESFARFQKEGQGPLCSECGGYLKTATISFGQGLRPDDLDRASQAAAQCDLVVAMGSTLSVYPAAEFPLLAARRGVPYAIINRGVTEHDQMALVSLRLEGDVSEIFPKAVTQALK